MWPFPKTPNKETLQDRKTVTICGQVFVIRKVNPLIDFPANKIPQIFSTAIIPRRTDEKALPEAMVRKYIDDMFATIEAGVVEPHIIPIGKGSARGYEEGITVEDIFRDQEVGYRLYVEILTHSLWKFRGIKGVFFSVVKKHLLYSVYRKNLGTVRPPSVSEMANSL